MTAVPKEYYVAVEIHLSKTAVTSRKSALARKRDKRDSIRSPSGSTDKKVKEKSSWLNLTRGSSTHDYWRPATCKLVEEDGGCIFRVYIDDSILYQSVHLHSLNHFDIRHVHRSLFDRKDCLGIFCVAGQCWSPTGNTEPLYLHFSDTDLMNAWMGLLRSYAMPEVYGRWFSATEGGLYRMWRQVKLVCQQGRGLGTSRPFPEDPLAADPEARQEPDAIDMDVYCEIYVNGSLSGRTTVKKGIGAPDWHETFTFTDLAPFEKLEIVVMREKKLMKSVAVGSILVYLMNFRRGEYVEGWFPVVNGNGHIGVQAGEMRLKLRVDEEIILPYNIYTPLLRTLQSRNYLDWLTDLEVKLKLKSISENVMSVALAGNVLVQNIMELADREVDGTHRSHTTLFRGNTVFTKTMEIFMAWYGASFLEASVGPIIRRLCSEKVSIEIDPIRVGKSTKVLERNVDVLVQWCREFWKSIYDARMQCPNEMRQVFAHIRKLVEKRHRVEGDQNRERPWQSVSSFLFLRFIVPAILHPHLFGIWPGLTEEPVQRSLTLIAKVIQSLANLNTAVQKEDYMRAVKEFLSSTSDAMIDYILVVSSPDDHHHQDTTTSPNKESREKNLILNALKQRLSSSPLLHREAIPVLPHLLDVPKHLAVIISVVVRHSRRQGYPRRTNNPNDAAFDELCSRCLDVEEQALFRVSQLARKQRRHEGHGSPHDSSPLASPTLSMPPPSPAIIVASTTTTITTIVAGGTRAPSSSQSSPTSATTRERKISLPGSGKIRKSRKSVRPSTAPNHRDSDDGPSAGNQTDISVPPSPTVANNNNNSNTNYYWQSGSTSPSAGQGQFNPGPSGSSGFAKLYTRASISGPSGSGVGRQYVISSPVGPQRLQEAASISGNIQEVMVSSPGPASPQSPKQFHQQGGDEDETVSFPSSPRPAYLHHPRSTSTDSALLNKNVPSLMSSHSSSSMSQSISTDNTDETGKKRKGLFRGILVRR